ncbi:hypothetical protein PAXRUDRAFT_832325 [Paxillus rubicundulus Ve08.2h10]|uniref:Uncharacterized protein n=1 Tax=Paxillus rubicundulus Ve08.2h10 TaxID=930991 RepID=A0A0D0CHQ3_9AGAM|nr:hypothetical protein PAXRUDRAFT_832325 [Paxillus rubicundulus Ve08.2h10]
MSHSNDPEHEHDPLDDMSYIMHHASYITRIMNHLISCGPFIQVSSTRPHDGEPTIHRQPCQPLRECLTPSLPLHT